MRSLRWDIGSNFSMQQFHMLHVPDEIGATPAIVASASCMVEYPEAVIHIALCRLLGAPCILVLAY